VTNKTVINKAALSLTALCLFLLLPLFAWGSGDLVKFPKNYAEDVLYTTVYRGRVVSLYTFCIFALTPLGSLLIGWEAEYWGEPTALILNAMIVPQVRQQHG